MRPKKQKMPLTPKVTFVGGKWYNELGKEVPKPQPKPFLDSVTQAPQQQQQGQLQRYGTPAPPPAPFIRYDEKRIEGCRCSRPSLTGHVPGCPHYKEAMYNCEGADPVSLRQIAGDKPLDKLQFDRLTYQAFPVVLDKDMAAEEMLRRKRMCQTDLIQTDVPRRRCWLCPFWDRNKEVTPFDHQKLPQEALSDFPKALDEDDDLPF